MKIKLKRIRQLGYQNSKSKQWRQTSEEAKRTDISRKKLYLVRYSGMWLIGRFHMQWYGWNFEPNYGANSLQMDCLDDQIYEIVGGLKQDKDGSTASHILGYLAEDGQLDKDEESCS